jgi:hypothetical protein
MVDTEDIGLATFQANRQNELAVRAEKIIDMLLQRIIIHQFNLF